LDTIEDFWENGRGKEEGGEKYRNVNAELDSLIKEDQKKIDIEPGRNLKMAGEKVVNIYEEICSKLCQ